MMTMKRLARGVALSALLSASATAVYAQETTGSIRGQVTNESGAPVGGAAVTIVHTPSGTRSTTVTDSNGVYDARGLRIGGPFTITVSGAEGSTSFEDVYTQIGDTVRADIAFTNEVEEIVVTAATDPTADNSGVKTALSTVDIASTVSVTRDIRDLARRSPLVSQNARGDGGISIAGSNPRNNRITIDGAQAQDDYGLNTGGSPIKRGPVSLDAIEQFSVDAVPVDVENGDFSGGALDVVLKSGGNDFHGTAFLNYLNDGMVGRSLRGNKVPSQVSQRNYGGFLSGPIWKDRVFFAASYELYKSSDLTSIGPTDGGFTNSVTGVNQALIDQVIGIFNNQYAADFDTGNILRTMPIKDIKYSLKLDANITDRHRASFTYRYGLSETYSTPRTNLSRTTASLSSQWYLTGEEDYAYVGELNSDWTNNLSTQLRVTYRDYERRQLPPSGQEFADISVCTAAVSGGSATTCDLTGAANPSIIRFGPDEFRQANELATENLQIQFRGVYTKGDHVLKFGFHSQKNDIANLFLGQQDGVYYFDSIADFQNGLANRLRYADAVGGADLESTRAVLSYRVNSLFLQDTLTVTPDLEITAGFRYDWYKNDSPPPLNPNFLARNGFSNQTTYDGRTVLMPRVAFKWQATPNFRLLGGLGLFSGGVPDVLATNPYGGGVGTLSSGIDITRNTATGLFAESTNTPGFTQAIGAAALNINRADPRAFYDIPAAVRTFQGGAVASPSSEVAAFLPGFKFPSDWKFFLTAQYDLPWSWAEGWRAGFDLVATRVNDGLYIRDTRAQLLTINGQQARLPDGRLRYDGVNATAAQRLAAGVTSTAPASTRDLVFYNTDKGYGVVAALSLRKSFDFGLDVDASYTMQNIKDLTSSLRFSSTQSSSYQSPAGIDPNTPAYGRSYEEIKGSWKAGLAYHKKFFGDLETRVTLFGERRSGRPTTLVMGDLTTGRGPVFGVNRGNNHLLYVPDMSGNGGASGLDYGLVTFADTSTRDNFKKLVDQFGLEQNAIVKKNSYRNDDLNMLDLQFSQELPSVFKGHKFRLVVDVQNVLNLLNDKWGIIEEYTDVNNVVSVQCATASGAAVATGDFACPRYRYSAFNGGSLIENVDTNGRSLWTIQVGLRYEF